MLSIRIVLAGMNKFSVLSKKRKYIPDSEQVSVFHEIPIHLWTCSPNLQYAANHMALWETILSSGPCKEQHWGVSLEQACWHISKESCFIIFFQFSSWWKLENTWIFAIWGDDSYSIEVPVMAVLGEKHFTGKQRTKYVPIQSLWGTWNFNLFAKIVEKAC